MKTQKEHDEQAFVVKWMKHAFPAYCGVFFAIPNGGYRTIKTAKSLQAEGVLPGVADLFLAVPRNIYHGLFIEMKKVKGGVQSDCQKEFEINVTNQGYKYVLCRGAAIAISEITNYMRS